MNPRHASLWIETAPAAPRDRLERDLDVDVLVLGGGMLGLTAAWMLQEQGRSVTVLEAGTMVSGVTGHTTAKVTSQHGLHYATMGDRFGEEAARLHAQANEQARETVRAAIERLGVDARWTAAPSYVYTTEPEQVAALEAETEAAKAAGLPASFTTETELPFPVAGAVRFAGQAHFHPRRYLLAVAADLERQGAQLFERTRVTSIEDGRPCKVQANGHEVRAQEVIVATNSPINDRAFYTPRMEVRREYGMACSAAEPVEGMYVSTGPDVRSVRPYASDDGPMHVYAGEKHPLGMDTSQRFTQLANFTRRFGDGDVRFQWSTQDAYSVDGIPLIGRYAPTAKHTWAGTGFGGWGMTQTTVAAKILTERILERGDEALHDLYDPFRPGRMLKDVVQPSFLKAQGKIAKKFVTERLVRQEAAPLGRGQGKIVTIDGEKMALHRDEDGILRAHDPRCTHMGCYVAWNTVESSWDCPCHGSRFAGDGRPLHGPATAALEAISIQQADVEQELGHGKPARKDGPRNDGPHD